MSSHRIAILGATSHIAKGLIVNFLEDGIFELHLFTRSDEKLKTFLAAHCQGPLVRPVIHDGYSDFAGFSYDAIINCVGVGTLHRLRGDFSRYFTVGEEYDNLVTNYLRSRSPETLYISFSSGAVYGRDHGSPFQDDTCNTIPVNHVTKEDYYAITRLYSEAKHRSFTELRIVDLRIFSYFSRFVDISDGYFITEILDSILRDKVLLTGAADMVRDYLHPRDLFAMVMACMQNGRVNAAYDVQSLKPTGKNEILDFFSREYGLRYEITESFEGASATGGKQVYCSNFTAASAIGYTPAYSSMETLKLESRPILAGFAWG